MSCNKNLYFLLVIATIVFVNQISADVVKGILLGSLIASKYQKRIDFVPIPYYDYLTQLENRLENVFKTFNQYSQHNRYLTTAAPFSTSTRTPSTTTVSRPTSTTTPSTTTTTSIPTTTTTSPTTTTSFTTSSYDYDYAKELVMVMLNPENIHKAKPYQLMPESISNDFESWLLSEIASEDHNHQQNREGYHDNGVLELDLSNIKQFDQTSHVNKH